MSLRSTWWLVSRWLADKWGWIWLLEMKLAMAHLYNALQCCPKVLPIIRMFYYSFVGLKRKGRAIPKLCYCRQSCPLNAKGIATDRLAGWTQNRSPFTAHSAIQQFPLGLTVHFTSRRWYLWRLHLSSKMLQLSQWFSYMKHLQLWSLRGHETPVCPREGKGQLYFVFICPFLNSLSFLCSKIQDCGDKAASVLHFLNLKNNILDDFIYLCFMFFLTHSSHCTPKFNV